MMGGSILDLALLALVPLGFWVARRGWFGSRIGGFAVFFVGCLIVTAGLVGLML